MTLAVLLCGCAASNDTPPVASPSAEAVSSTTAPPAPPLSRAAALREWEAVAREHFRESATALQEVSEASAAEDEAGLRAGCQRLHDTNSIGLQQTLPTPEPELTVEVQRMIGDMNVATHACLRFALGRDPVDAANYQQYLARAVEHLYRAKAILAAVR